MKFEHIGWMKEGNSDKVWGMIRLKSGQAGWWAVHTYVTFWGRRGKKLQTTVVECTEYDAGKQFGKKVGKGYKSVDENKLHEVYPEFKEDLEKTAVWATLSI